MRIQHNIMAMSAYRNYTNNVSAMKKNLEKLSSGYKINRAGDDAAGLAISEKMRAQITGLETAQKNAKDGISLVQTAEGALTEVHDMLNRMVELATQSANGTYDSTTDRAQMQKELQQLREEIDRIADSSNFNGIKLFDGSMDPATEGIGATEAVEGTTSTLVSSQAGGTLGTNTITHSSGAQYKATEFGVDLHEVAFSNEQGEALEIDIGGEKFTLEGDGTGAMNAKAVVDAFVADKFKDSTGAAIDHTALSIAGSDFTVTANNGTGLKFTLVDGQTPIDADKQVAISGKASNVWTTGAYTAGVEGNAAADGGGAAVGYDETVIGATATINGATVTFGDANSKVDYDADADTLAAAYGNLEDADGHKLSEYFDVAADGDGKITLTAKTGGDKITALTFTAGTTATGTANAAHPAAQAAMTAGANAEGANPVSGHYNTRTTITDNGSAAGNRRIASGVATLTASTFTNGNTIRVGDKTYTVSTDAADKGTGAGVSGKIYVGDLTLSNAADLKKAIDRLSVQTADNSVWTVGQGTTAGQVTFVEKVDAANKSYTELNTTNGKLNDGAFDLTKEDVIKSTFGTVTGAKEATDGVNGKQLVLQIGDTADPYNQLKVTMKDMHVNKIGQALKDDGTGKMVVDTSVAGGDLSIGSISILNQEDAAKAVDVIKRAINQVSDMRGTLGATQNRLDHTINNLSVMTENIQDAESTIRDTDVADEMMAYTKNNILIQSAQAMLAQANQVPQGVLQLLQ